MTHLERLEGALGQKLRDPSSSPVLYLFLWHNIRMNGEGNELGEQITQSAISYDSRTLRLLELLSEKSESLANMLRGAWTTLNVLDNPDMLPQVAHSMRELMEKASIMLPNVPIEQGSNSLKNDVKVLGDKWQTIAQERGNAFEWSNEVDDRLRELLTEFGTFFAEFSNKYQPRNEQNTALIQALDSSGGQIPNHILSSRLKQWNDMRQFFLKVAHHGMPNVTAEEVTKAIVELEEFLLSLISPEPIPDLAELDVLIAEGEAI